MKLKKENMNFEKCDSILDMQWYNLRAEAVKALDYDYVTEYMFVAYFEEYQTFVQLSAVLGVTAKTVYNWFQKLQWPSRPPGFRGGAPREDLIKETLIEMREEGLSLRDIAGKFGCSHSTIRRVINEG